MNFIDTALSKLRGLTGAAELRKTEPELRNAMHQAEALVAELKAKVAVAPFEADAAAVRKVREELRAAESDAETLHDVLAETQRRREAAEKAEKLDNGKSGLRAARLRRDELRDAFIEVDMHAHAIGQLVRKIGTLASEIANANTVATEVGLEPLRSPRVNVQVLEDGLKILRSGSMSDQFAAMAAAGRDELGGDR